MFKKLFFALAATLLLVQGVALYGLAGAAELGYLFGGAFLLFMAIINRNVLSIVASFFGATLLVWGAISLFGLYEANCYRPEQILSAYDMTLDSALHTPDAEVRMVQPYGDLGAMTADPAVPRSAREVVFRTDSLGYRNDLAPAPGDVLLIGDDFVQGSGMTQADTLASVLRREHGVAAYAVGAPGDMMDYAVRVQAYAAQRDAPVFLFVFEGDDFHTYKARLRPILARYVRLMRSTQMGKFFRQQMARLRDSSGDAGHVEVMQLESNGIAFYRPFVDETLRTERPSGDLFVPLLKSMRGLVDGVFFIPTKYRVYAPLMGVEQQDELPATDWAFLEEACNEAQIPCYNLTEPMRAEARTLWDTRSELLWWPDDSHWNRNGVAVAARAVADVLNGKDIVPEPAAAPEQRAVPAAGGTDTQ